MDNFHSFPIFSEGKGKKKVVNKSSWKREQLKKKRYLPKKLPTVPGCTHKKKNLQCADISIQDIRRFYESFYANKEKIAQDNFILKYTSQTKPKRIRRSGNEIQGTPFKGISINYFVRSKNDGLLQVCQTTFLQILRISKFRVQNICKNHLSAGQTPQEKRGGDTRSTKYQQKKGEVVNFIKKLNCVESHYTRENSIRQYFPSDWSVKLLWKQYNNEADTRLKVKYHFFWEILRRDFNLSFDTPATDACSECIRLKSLIKCSGNEKVLTMAKYAVHKKKAKAFHEMLQKPCEEIFKFSFDCQKNLVLPKVPDQAAYYSRQLYQYNLTICEGTSKNKQTSDTVKIFTWSEDQRFKGSNEIASILFYYLKGLSFESCSKIQMFSDGCPGQNKNITVIGMLAKWLLELSPPKIESIEFVFPIVGHSYLPSDRVFGRIEKELRKMDTIIQPEEYKKIFSKYGQVKNVGEEVPILDFKSSVARNVKTPGQLHFPFASSKRIMLLKQNKNIVVKGEVNYKVDSGSFKSITKKGKSLRLITPDLLDNKVPVKEEKLKDVQKLLVKHFGNEWKEMDNLFYYKNVIFSPQEQLQEIQNDEEEIPEEQEVFTI